MQKAIQNISKQWHMVLHVVFGLFSAGVFMLVFKEIELKYLIIGSLLGSLLPDIDHLFFCYVYGRDTEYSRNIREHVWNLNYKDFSKFAKDNHKDNHFILSHNIGTLVLSLICALILLKLGNIYWANFSFAFASHFLYDIFEDYLFHGKLNPNWTFKFSKPA